MREPLIRCLLVVLIELVFLLILLGLLLHRLGRGPTWTLGRAFGAGIGDLALLLPLGGLLGSLGILFLLLGGLFGSLGSLLLCVLSKAILAKG